MADIFGTGADDFFHLEGDGLITPDGYTEVFYQRGDRVHGFTGDDIFAGTDGVNAYMGYNGNDTLDYTSFGRALNFTAVLSNGFYIIQARSDFAVVSYYWPDIEAIRATAFDDIIVMQDSVHTALGNGGDDLIVASSWPSSILGGAGNDTVSYALSDAGVTIDLGLDSVQASGGFGNGDLLDSIENVTGSTLDDALSGDEGNNVIEGGAGADTLNGHGGIDTASYAGSDAGVSVVLNGAAAGGHAQGDTLANFENLTGSAFNDVLVGDTGNNRLEGSDGNDLLMGGAGADILIGGAGIDTASYGNAAAAISVSLASGIGQSGEALGDALTGIENLSGSDFADFLEGDGNANRLSGLDGSDDLFGDDGDDVLLGGGSGDTLGGDAGDDTLKGEAGNDTLYGGEGNDRLDGGTGGDYMAGGAGNDTYYVDDARDTAIEAAGEGTDRVNAGISWSLTDEIEILTLTGTATQGTGNDLDNTITGNAGDNILGGGSGNDTLKGMDGADILDGGAGNDRLAGGGGADLFALRNPGDGVDTILDWERNTDRIGLDTAAFGLGDAPSRILNGTAFDPATDLSLFYQTSTGRLYFHEVETGTLTLLANLGSDRPNYMGASDFVLI